MMETDALRLPAPAKLNLMLRIIGRREDGYHLLQTVFQFIDRCDWITLRAREDGQIRLATPLPGVPEESDLTVRAARLLRANIGGRYGADIAIEKILPMGGGLGGGSSDAATVLLGLNRLWGCGRTLGELAELGLRLGADVPIFVFGRSAWAEGVGEKLSPIEVPELWYLILIPPCEVATGKVFSSPQLTRDNESITMQHFFAGRHENHCLPVVETMYPKVREALEDLRGVSGEARLTGTGACVFAAFHAEDDARQAEAALSGKWRGFVTRGRNLSPLHRALGTVSTQSDRVIGA